MCLTKAANKMKIIKALSLSLATMWCYYVGDLLQLCPTIE